IVSTSVSQWLERDSRRAVEKSSIRQERLIGNRVAKNVARTLCKGQGTGEKSCFTPKVRIIGGRDERGTSKIELRWWPACLISRKFGGPRGAGGDQTSGWQTPARLRSFVGLREAVHCINPCGE